MMRAIAAAMSKFAACASSIRSVSSFERKSRHQSSFGGRFDGVPGAARYEFGTSTATSGCSVVRHPASMGARHNPTDAANIRRNRKRLARVLRASKGSAIGRTRDNALMGPQLPGRRSRYPQPPKAATTAANYQADQARPAKINEMLWVSAQAWPRCRTAVESLRLILKRIQVLGITIRRAPPVHQCATDLYQSRISIPFQCSTPVKRWTYS